MVIRDIRTRWNYTHAMIRRALLQKDVCANIFLLFRVELDDFT